jgi:hypothetical protein
VFDVVDKGTHRKDGSIDYLILLVEELASNSRTGKVTMLGHSNGGLLLKALMIRLESMGKQDIVDKVILVSTPQLGTPRGAFALQHGDNTLPGFLADQIIVRSSLSSMPGMYGFVPSESHFPSGLPIFVFGVGTSTNPYRDAYGPSLDTFISMVAFLLNNPSTRSAADVYKANVPLPLKEPLMISASETHALLDAWVPPVGVEISEIAGWGNMTPIATRYFTRSKFACPSGLRSCGSYSYLDQLPITHWDGDGTVLSSSSLRKPTGLYFDLYTLQDKYNEIREHNNIVSSASFHAYLGSRLGVRGDYPSDLFVSTKPLTPEDDLLYLSAHSPVLFSVTDAVGNESGFLSVPESDMVYTTEEIPKSIVYLGGEGKYVSVPRTGVYNVSLKGAGTGVFDFKVEDDPGHGIKTYENIPVSTTTQAALTITDGIVGDLTLDTNSDGSIDYVLQESTFGKAQALQYCKNIVTRLPSRLMSLVLLAKLIVLEKVETQNTKFATILAEFLNFVIAKYEKNLTPEEAAAMGTCVNLLQQSK